MAPTSVPASKGVSLAAILPDRRHVSRYSISSLGLRIFKDTTPQDADGDVMVTLRAHDDEGVVVLHRAAERTDLGEYQVTLSSVETSTPGFYGLEWRYALGGIDQEFVGYVEVGDASPAYDALAPEFKAIVESAWIRFADLFDSPAGGPHLQVYFQTRFNRERMAQLLAIAVGRLNTFAQPRTTYSLDASSRPFPVAQWGPLLDQALYIECIKHLVRSYVEQPDTMGVVVARLDRRDYMARWQNVLTAEQREFDSAIDAFKIAHMGLGRPRVMVSGGIYGTLASSLTTGYPGQPRFWARFY